MHRRKIIRVMQALLGFILLLGGISTAHVVPGARVEEVVTRSAPRSLHHGRLQAMPLPRVLSLQDSPGSRVLGTSLATADRDIQFAFVGYTKSSGASGSDAWLVKANANGNMEWQQTYSYSSRYDTSDSARAVIQTNDGGYALAGLTCFADCCFWLVRTDVTGNKEWRQSYYSNHFCNLITVIPTADGGFVLAGSLASRSLGHGYSILWKVDANGVIQWHQYYQGDDEYRISTVIPTADGGFAVAGSYRCNVFSGYSDFWLVKTDACGVTQWNRTYGGSKDDRAYSVVETLEGGFVLAGFTGEGYQIGGVGDAWLVKTDDRGVAQWNRTYGDSEYDSARAVIQTTNGEFVLVGITKSAGTDNWDAWLVKTNARGNKVWGRTYGGADNEEIYSGIQTADDGFALAGSTWSYGAGNADFWLVKTDDRGVAQWNRTYGSSKDDRAYSIIRTADNGFVLAGSTKPDTTPPVVMLTSPQNTTYTTRRIPIYATNTTELVHSAWWRYWNDSWSANQTLTWDEAEGWWEAEGLTWLDGSYHVQVFFKDSVGNTAVASEKFTVDTTPPTISSPIDITCEEGMTGHIIAWVVWDRHPGIYVIYLNSEQMDSESWTNGTIPWNVDGLTQGTYNVTLVVEDTAGYRVSDTVWITVTTSTTPPLPELPMIGTLVLLSLVTSTILCVRRKKSNSK